ncbi:hypothetical protein FB451DRAFT_1185306 [Mycena latifolia]|nr:hypothetical protein FB451DRAFT_1185306 [Mycena latifolia]
MTALLAFLALFDVVGPSAVDALHSVVGPRPALFGLLSVLDAAEVAKELEGEDDEAEEELAKREMVLGELLKMAMRLDYMDEIEFGCIRWANVEEALPGRGPCLWHGIVFFFFLLLSLGLSGDLYHTGTNWSGSKLPKPMEIC